MSTEPLYVTPPGCRIFPADCTEHYQSARSLFMRYAESLDFDLDFQDFDRELDTRPGAYAPPRGTLLIAERNGLHVGCVGVRPLEHDICEMKRLYVEPEARGIHLGQCLARASIRSAQQMGYRTMRLDTVGTMREAIALYRRLGFYSIAPYRPNPIPSAQYFELILS